jgi:two-component system copper resistance phosphate regulon response regulator CusR
MQRLLIIEDEIKTAQSLKQGLEEHQYKVEIVNNGTLGKEIAMNEKFDVIITDIILPGINGIDLCRQLRDAKVLTPILMLTALSTVDDKVEGFNSGADDYLAKPFEFKELLARIRALLKRSPQTFSNDNILSIADMELNLNTKKAWRNGKEIDLTAREFALLEYFIRNKGRVLSKTEIAEQVWGIGFDTGTNVVEVYINYVRKKIDKGSTKKLIHTQFGMGYIMKEK